MDASRDASLHRAMGSGLVLQQCVMARSVPLDVPVLQYVPPLLNSNGKGLTYPV